MVGNSRPGEWLTSRKTVLGGGSSSTFRIALAPFRFNSSALSMTIAFHAPSEAVR
jgi:hypothetical protein